MLLWLAVVQFIKIENTQSFSFSVQKNKYEPVQVLFTDSLVLHLLMLNRTYHFKSELLLFVLYLYS